MVLQLLINPSVPCIKYCMPWLIPINVSWRAHSTSKQFLATHVLLTMHTSMVQSIPIQRATCCHSIPSTRLFFHPQRFSQLHAGARKLRLARSSPAGFREVDARKSCLRRPTSSAANSCLKIVWWPAAKHATEVAIAWQNVGRCKAIFREKLSDLSGS